MSAETLWVMNDALSEPERQAEALFFLLAYFGDSDGMRLLEVSPPNHTELALSVYHQILANIGSLWREKWELDVINLVRCVGLHVSLEHVSGPPMLESRLSFARANRIQPDIDLSSPKFGDPGHLMDQSVREVDFIRWDRVASLCRHCEKLCNEMAGHDDVLAAAVAGRALAAAYIGDEEASVGTVSASGLLSRAEKLVEIVSSGARSGMPPHKIAEKFLHRTKLRTGLWDA